MENKLRKTFFKKEFPMFKLLISAFILAAFAFADGFILKTGQVKSYDENGNEVPYGAIKDDGYYRAGQIRSYKKNGGIVKDNTLSLEWQNNDPSADKVWITIANLNAGKYNDTSGDTAATYCSELSLDTGGWRLPTIQELRTLADYGPYYPAVTQGVFNQFEQAYYWSSTTTGDDDLYAYTVDFLDGHIWKYVKNCNGCFQLNTYVRCVRGSQLPPSSYERDFSAETVTDKTTGLQWQDNYNTDQLTKRFGPAIDYCEDYTSSDGKNDWRLPNINELLSIAKYSKFVYDPAISNYFYHASSEVYWSSTTAVDDGKYAWIVWFKLGTSGFNKKTDPAHVRCVRGGISTFNPAIIMYLLN